MAKVFLNGRYVPLKAAKVSVFDRGFLYGDGVFETMRAYNGNVFKLDEHMRRLFTGLGAVRIKLPVARRRLSSLVDGTVSVNRLKDAYIKVLVSRGSGQPGVDMPRPQKPTMLIYAGKLGGISQSKYKKGIRARFSRVRKNENSFISGLKSLNYLENILARAEARSGGFDEAIFVNSRGMVTEAATSNIFAVRKGRIFTPPSGAGLLPGVTRRVVLDIVRKYLGNDVFEENITRDKLLLSDEVFLTNAVLELVPVVRIGSRTIGYGGPGVMYRILHALYRREVEVICSGSV